MHRTVSVAFASAMLVFTGACTPSTETGDTSPPSLIVAMPIDQLRSDLLHRYDALFTGGFRRILDQGLHHPNATHEHAATSTAVGHTTLGTGVYPTRHGIVGNEWNERQDDGSWRTVYSMEDRAVSILGHTAYPGRSPANLYREGLGDWLLAHSPESRVAAVSGKDRTSIPMSGKARGEIYWLLAEQGEFVTSSWYRDDYPEWVVRFNRERMPELYGDTIWESIVPPEAAHLTLPDTADYEAPGGGRFSYFPHRASVEAEGLDEERLRYNRWRQETPFPSRAIFAFAQELVQRLELGQRDVTDYLVVGISQTDHVGHRFGPLSREQLDNLLRIDRELGEFLDFLDREVGEGRWILGVSADHGVMDVPEDLSARGIPSRRLGQADRADIARVGREAAAAAEAAGDDPEARSERVAAALRAHPEIAVAISLHQLEAGPTGDTLVDLFRNSLSRTRQTSSFRDFDVMVANQEHVFASRAFGATHGTPYYYDRTVPLTFLGAGIRPGRSLERVATVDFAPTLAALAGITVPDDVDGRVVVRR